MDLELTGKVAIVTGASRGIGKAVARELALEGADVAAVARGREALEATAAEIAGESGRRVLALTADTSDDASVQAMVRAAHEAFGRVDILVNNAASPGSALPPAPLDELTDDHVRADIEVKVLGYLRTARAVAPIMREQGWGRIVGVIGRSDVAIVEEAVTVAVCGHQLFERTVPIPYEEAEVSRAMSGDEVTIEVSLGAGDASATGWTCDFSAGYIRINADYTT